MPAGDERHVARDEPPMQSRRIVRALHARYMWPVPTVDDCLNLPVRTNSNSFVRFD
jgi:hypothetical protein